VNARGFWGCTPLHFCVGGATGGEEVTQVHEQMAKMLLAHPRIDVDIVDMAGQTVLHRAQKLGCTKLALILQDQYKANQSIKDRNGLTPEELGRLAGNKKIQGPFSINFAAQGMREGQHSVMSMGVAEQGGNQDVLQDSASLATGFSYQKWGWPLFVAAYFGKTDEVRRVLSGGALPGRADAYGRTLLHWCSAWGLESHVDVARTLLEHGANPFAADLLGRTPLHWAGAYGNDGMAEVLKSALTEMDQDAENAWDAVVDNTGFSSAALKSARGMALDTEDANELEMAVVKACSMRFFDASFPTSLVALAADPAKLPTRFLSVEWLQPDEMADDIAGCKPAMFAAAREGMGEVQHCGNGLYRVICSKNGQEEVVMVDDLLPCIDRRPAFGGSVGQKEDLILQKGYAKLHGSYEWILCADWSKSTVPHTALGWEAPQSLDQEHPLAPLAMEHALAVANALFSTPLSGTSGQTGKDFLHTFAGEFSQGDSAQEINSLENAMDNASSSGIAGGPSGIPVMGKGKTLKVSPSEAGWVKIAVNQLGTKCSVFINVYVDNGEEWLQNASGFAHQQEQECVLEVYLEPRDQPYLVVAAATLDSFGNDFTLDIDSSVELTVVEA